MGGIVEAVADHNGPASKRRLNDLPHELRAASLVEQQLTLVCHLRICRIQHEGTNLLGDGGATRLAQGNNLVAPGAQALYQQQRLRRLARAVRTLKGNEHAPIR